MWKGGRVHARVGGEHMHALLGGGGVKESGDIPEEYI